MAASFALVQAAAATGGGNQSFTKSGFGTPDAAMFIISNGITNGTMVDNAAIGIGFTDGTDHRAITLQSGHGSGNSSCDEENFTDEVIAIMDNVGAVDGEANFNAFVTDGVQVTWGSNPSVGFLITCLLIKADNVKVGHYRTASGGDADHDEEVGFEPTVIFQIMTDLISFPGSTNSCRFSFGVGVNNDPIQQGIMSFAQSDGTASSVVGGEIASNRVTMEHTTSTSPDNDGELTSFSSSSPNGFTVTTRNNGSLDVAYLAIDTGGTLEFSLDAVDGPADTGNDAQTQPGFTPQFVLTFGANFTGYSSGVNDGRTHGMFISMVTPTEEFCNEIVIEDSPSTMDTSSIVDDKAINHSLHDATLEHEATFVSMDANGYTFNFSTAGTLRKWLAFTMEEDAVPVYEQVSFRFRNDDGDLGPPP